MLGVRSVNKLTNTDYKNILKHYNIQVPNSKQMLKQQAEQIMATKLCKCIKGISLNDEPKSIGICTKNIFNNKGYTRGKFQCKKTQYVKFIKTNKNKTRRKHK